MRWTPDARGRLERAAGELFAEQGYAATTVPQITARAGLTTRTFFRYFADKREVIFGGDDIPQHAGSLIAHAPPGLEPTAVLRMVLRQVGKERFTGSRAETAAWRRMIEDNAELRERDARKRNDMVLAARAAFIERGHSTLDATVFAEIGVLVFHVALNEWASAPEERSMTAIVDDVFDAMARLVPAAPREA